MKENTERSHSAEDQIGCIGEFDASDELCSKYCALKLRCAIEYHQNQRLEVIEDIVASSSTFVKIQ
ncbi:MAG: hypothetical protein P8Y38_01605 [Deltaproteobacteria bacterium]|jgi:hypothetical protein